MSLGSVAPTDPPIRRSFTLRTMIPLQVALQCYSIPGSPTSRQRRVAGRDQGLRTRCMPRGVRVREGNRGLAAGIQPVEAMKIVNTQPYRLAVITAIGTALLLPWVIGAVGLIGVEGDPFDLIYGGVLAVGLIGTIIARLRPRGMARALFATALAQALVVVIALIIGKQHVAVSSVPEIVLSNGFFVTLWLGSAWLFRRAAR